MNNETQLRSSKIDKWNKEEEQNQQALQNAQQVQNKEKITLKKSSDIKKWKNLQKLRYLFFIFAYQKDLEGDSKVQKNVWYEKLSQFIENARSVQCGHYHKKKLSKFGSIQNIINYLIKIIYFNKQQVAKEAQRAKSIIRKDPKFPKNNDEINNATKKEEKKLYEIIKFESLKPNTKCQQETKPKQNKNFNILKSNCVVTKITIEDLIIIQREVPFKYSNLKEQEQNIEKIINAFRNYESQIKDFDSFRKNCKKIMKKKSKQQKQQEQQNPCKQEPISDKDQKSFCSKKQTNRQQERQSRSDKLQKGQASHAKNKKGIFWQKSQRKALILFFNIVKEQYQTADQSNKYSFFQKCSVYINSDKTPKRCKQHFDYLCKQYQGSLSKMLQSKTKQLQISKQLIEKRRQKYISNEQNPLQCQLILKYEPIKYVKQYTKDAEKLNNQNTFLLSIPYTLGFDIHRKSQKSEQLPQNPQVKQQKNHQRKIIKHLLHLKVLNSIFSLIKNSAQNQINFKQSNFIVLIKKSFVKHTFQYIKKKEENFQQSKEDQFPLKTYQSQFAAQETANNYSTSTKYKNLIIPIKRFPNQQNDHHDFIPAKKQKKQ